MNKWFNEKLERDRLREYTQRRIERNSFLFFRRFSITNWIIFTNIAIFIILQILIAIFGSDRVIPLVALQANSFFAGKLWTVLTSMFVHLEVWHLFANMVSLFFIGNFVEKLIGRKRILGLYLLSGIFAGLFYATLSYYFGNSLFGAKIFLSPDVSAVGASGAIFSLLGLLAVLTPNSKVYMIVGPIIALVVQSIIITLFPNPGLSTALNFLVSFYLIFSVFLIFSFSSRMIKIAIPVQMSFWVLPFVAIVPLVIIGLFVELPIGNTAHLGGLIIGLFYAYYLRKKYKHKTAMIRRYFSR